MRSRAVRITLTLLAIIAIGAAAYFSFTVHTRTRAELEAATAFDQTRISALRDAYELRSTQQAYIAAGQNETFWFGKVTERIESLRAALTTLRGSTTSAAALTSVEEAATALDEFERVDGRARSYTTGGQKLLAADVIFSDGFETAALVTGALEKAGTEVASSTGAVSADAQRRQVMAIGGATGFAIFALLLLAPLGAGAPERAVAVAVEEPAASSLRLREEPKAPERQTSPNRDIREGRDVQRRRVTPAQGSASGPSRPVPSPRPEPVPSQPAVELQGLATLCTDLARLSDTTLLPGILERAATALDASGLVLWIADQDGAALTPIAAHGYPASVLSRMGSLRVDGQNATAAAFRTGLLQTVSADAGSSGAIAVPLLAPAGCRGVMSAEVRHDARKQPARLAAASIIAAQLATLVGPPAADAAQDRNTAAL